MLNEALRSGKDISVMDEDKDAIDEFFNPSQNTEQPRLS